MKLELKNIAHFLPYGIEVEFTYYGKSASKYLLTGLILMDWITSRGSMRLILYPLSVISDEDIERMSNRLEYQISWDGENFQIDDSVLGIDEIPHVCWNYLVEKGFDVENLIEEGLAVINDEPRRF